MDRWLHPLWCVGWNNYPLPSFNGTTVDVWEWIRNFTPHFIMANGNYLSMMEVKLNHVSKWDPRSSMVLFAALPIEYEVHVLVGDIYYPDVTHIEHRLMNTCLVLTKPLITFTNVHLTRPCAFAIKGRYLYVVMAIMDGTTATMGIVDLKVYAGRL